MYRKIALLFYVCLSLAAAAQQADLGVTKIGPDSVPQNADATYTVTVTNFGPSAAVDVVLTDVLLGDATFVSVTPPAGCTGTTCTIASLASGASAAYQFTFHTDDDAAGTLEDTATVSAATPDGNAQNNTAMYSTTVIPVADLFVTKNGPATAAAGADVTYTITLDNLGPNDAANVTLNDAIPAGMTFVSATQLDGPAFNCSTPNPGDPGNVNCTLALMVEGTGATFELVFEIDGNAAPGTSFTNVATATTTTFEVNEEDNTAVAVTTTPPPPQADLAVGKIAPGAAGADTDLTFTVTLSNGGPDAATNVTLSDTLPGDLTFVSLGQTGTAMACGTPAVGAGGTITCTSASFPAGGSATLTITAHVPPGTPSGTAYTNTAFVTSDSDPFDENDSASFTVTISAVDLSVVKTGPAVVTAADNISYGITVSNAGPDIATSITLRDELPPGTSFVSINQNSGPSAVCSFDGDTVLCGNLILAMNQTATFTLVLDPGANSEVINTATVDTESFETDPSDDSSSVTTDVTPVADLSVLKTGPATVTAGTNAVYTVTVTNLGPSTATDVVLTDVFIGDGTFVSVTPSSGCTGTTCTIATLAPSASAVYTYTFHIDEDAAGGVENTATVAATTPDSAAGNNSSVLSSPVVGSADLSVVKTGPATVTPGTDVTYTVTVTNLGPSTAFNVVVNDFILGDATFVSVTPSTGCTGATCPIASLAAGASAAFSYTFHVSPSASGTIQNNAQALADTDDPVAGNDSDSVDSAVVGSADVSVVKTGPGAVTTGTNATYTIVVANAGPSDAANVTLTDVLPANTTFVSLNQSGPAFNCTTGPTVTCTIATLPVSASTTFTLVVAVSAAAAEPIVNTATVSSTTADPNAANNSSTDTLALNPGPTDLAIAKTANGTSFGFGGAVMYTIVVTNNGPSVAFGTTVTDILPAGTTLESASPTQGSCAGTTTVVCSLGTIAPAATATITLVVRLPREQTTVTNTATVTAANAETAPGNNASTVALAVTAEIPTVSEWGLILMALALAVLAVKTMRA